MKRELLGLSAGKAGWQHIVGALDHLLTKVLTFSRSEMESFQGHLRWRNSKITSRFGCFSDGGYWKTVKARKRIVIQQDMPGMYYGNAVKMRKRQKGCRRISHLNTGDPL